MSVAPIIPTGCPWVYDVLVGQEWPAGDEDSMRRGAHAWLDAKKGIEQVAGNGDDASAGVTDNVQAVSVEAFTAFWNEYIAGDKSVLGELLQQCDGLASALNGQADELEYAKLSIDITIVLIAIQILIAIAEAVFSMGGSLLEIPFITVFGQRAVAMLLGRFLQMALMMILPDVITQVAMQVHGDQKGWDWSKTIPALESAGIAGVLGMSGGAAVAKLPFMSTEVAGTLGGKVLQGLVHFGEGGTVNVMTGLSVDMINGKQIDPGMLLTQFVSGGFMATAFYLPHVFGPEGTPLTFIGSDGKNYHILLDSSAMDEFNANGQRLPDGFTAPVYSEKGMRVGTATFSDVGPTPDTGGQTVRIDTILGHGQPTNLTGYSLAGHDGSVQTYGFDHGQVSLKSYAAPSDGRVKIATIQDGAQVDQTVPAGSIVRYTSDGIPYRADIADGSTVAIWQTSAPGSPLERTGTIVYPDVGPVGRFMGLEEATFYAQDGAQVGSISLLTGWLHVNDRASYDLAILDQYHAAADPLTALVGAGEVPADVAAAVRGTGVDVSRFADAMNADVRLDGPDLLAGSAKVQALAQVAADYGIRGLDLVAGGLSVRETAELVPVLDRAEIVDSFTPVFDEAGKPILTRLLPPGPDEGQAVPGDYATAGDHPRSAIAEALNGRDSLDRGSAATGHLPHDQLLPNGHVFARKIRAIEDSGDHRVYVLESANGDEVRVYLDRVRSGWVVSDDIGTGAGVRLRAKAEALVDDGKLNIVGHGDQYGLGFGRMHLSFDDLARLIGPVPDDVPAIRLLVCEAAKGDGPALLAQHFGRPVVATKEIVWFDKKGGVRSAAADVEFGLPRPGAPGDWEVYHPNGASRILLDGDPLRPSEVGRPGESQPGDVGDWDKAGFTPNEQPQDLPPKDVVDAVKSDPTGPDRAGVVDRFKRNAPMVRDAAGKLAPLSRGANADDQDNLNPELFPSLNRAMSRATYKVLLEALHLDRPEDADLSALIRQHEASGDQLGQILRDQLVRRRLASTAEISQIIADRHDAGFNEDQPRPMHGVIDEALATFVNPDLQRPVTGTDFADLQRIRITDVYGRGGRPADVTTQFPQYDPETQTGSGAHGSYDAISHELDVYRGKARVQGMADGEFDRQYADALLKLLNPSQQQAGLAELEQLSHAVDPRYGVDTRYPNLAQALATRRGYDSWTGGTVSGARYVNEGAAFVRQAVALCHLIFDIETARHPEALFANLAAFELVQRGLLPLQDVFFYNPMRPSMANAIAARVDWTHWYVKDFAPRPRGGRENNARILADIAEFQRREREIWGRYVEEYLGQDPAGFFNESVIIDGRNLDERLENLLRTMLSTAGISGS